MIRELTSQDVERVGAIWLDASLQAHDFVPAEFWRADHRVMVGEILPKAHGYVHLTEDVIDGFVTVRDGVIGCLFVDPRCQRRGIGQLLLGHVKSLAETLRLTVYEQNHDARRFYKRHGFRSIGRSRCQHTGCAEVVMQWTSEGQGNPR